MSLHDALPISQPRGVDVCMSDGTDLVRRGMRGSIEHVLQLVSSSGGRGRIGIIEGIEGAVDGFHEPPVAGAVVGRSEEHTSELQSRGQLVCRLLLEKKK